MKKRIVSVMAALALLLTLFPTGALASERAATHSVGSREEFMAAMSAAQAGDTIRLTTDIRITNPDRDNAPLILDKAVTITGSELINDYGGILLGADVTFQDIMLRFPNRSRNVIMANGHTLTLKNVSWDQAAQKCIWPAAV